MGADFLFAIARAPHTPEGDGVPDEKAMEIAKERARRALEAMGTAELDEFLEELGADTSYFEWDDPEREETDEEWRTRMISLAEELVESAVKSVIQLPRDTGLLTLDDKRYVITGGMSWGGTPTDSYDDVVLVDRLGLFDEPVVLASSVKELPSPLGGMLRHALLAEAIASTRMDRDGDGQTFSVDEPSREGDDDDV